MAYARGQGRLACRLLGAADSLRRAIGWTVQSLAARDREILIRALHGRLSPAQYDTEFQAGASLPHEEAIGEALELATAGAAGGARAVGPWATLTPREREVASLLARGCTNRQVATELVITEATAMRHVATILSKLGLTSRALVAALAAGNLQT